MSFDGYLRTIKTKTGLDPDDFVRLAAERGLIGTDARAADIISWLSADYGLGRGHAMAIVAVLKNALPASATGETLDGVDRVFSGPRQLWRDTYDQLWEYVQTLGPDVGVQPTKRYVSFTRDGSKFAIVQPSGTRLDIGVKLDADVDVPELSAASSWNAMVTHRAQVHDPADVDDVLLGYLRDAYARVRPRRLADRLRL